MGSDIRQLLAAAQAAEIKGDKPEAIKLLRKAAEFYRDHQKATLALKMLRHARRLEGVPEEEAEPVIEPVIPFEAQTFEGPKPERLMPERKPMLADVTLEAWCSFCCKPSKEVGQLVAAPTGTFICVICVSTASELLGKPK